MLKIYTKDHCKYCKLLTKLLDSHNKPYETVNVSEDNESLDMLKERGFKTVPQVFIGNLHIGDYTFVRDNIEILL